MALSLVPFVVVACDTAELSESEARETYEAVNTVTNDMVLLARDAVEQGSASLSVQGDAGELEIAGSATDGNGWTGTTSITGSAEVDGDRWVYELVVRYEQVELEDGPTVDGELSMLFWVDDFGSADYTWSVGVEMLGDLDVSGSASGHAALDYDLTLEVDGWSVSFLADGTINGFDVSGWSYDLSFSL